MTGLRLGVGLRVGVGLRPGVGLKVRVNLCQIPEELFFVALSAHRGKELQQMERLQAAEARLPLDR